MQEFNIQTDPEAAHVVFESGVSVAMVPIEVCMLLLNNVQMYTICEKRSSKNSTSVAV